MSKKTYWLFAAALFILPVATVAAATQTILADFRGKVEVLAPGASWVPANKGMVIAQGDTISTGFNSTAVLKVGASTVTVRPLTRMKLEELLQQPGKLTTRFSLPIGRVRASVKSADGSAQDFQIRSPIATAAVRGTEFDFDGNHLIVSEGTVRFSNNLGQVVFVMHGQQSTTGVNGTQSNPGQEETETVLPHTTELATLSGGASSNFGNITVTWQQ